MVNNNYFLAEEMIDGEYMAIVRADFRYPLAVIPEEHNGIPITHVMLGYGGDWNEGTIRMSKNVKSFVNDANNMFTETRAISIEIDPENPYICTDGKAVFSKDMKCLMVFTARDDKSYVIPDGVETIYKMAFQCANSLEDVVFPDTLKEIGEQAFEDSGLKKIILPDSIKKIERGAFWHVGKVEEIRLPRNAEDITPHIFDSTVCTSPLFIPDGFDVLKNEYPNGKSASSFLIDENSEKYALCDGILYSKDMKCILAAQPDVGGKIIIPDGVEVLADHAFDGNRNITEVVLPPSVSHIGCCCFQHCSSLKSINLEKVKEIDTSAFYDARKLENTGEITAEKIDLMSFYGCDSLKKIHLTNAKELIRDAFASIEKEEVILPEGLLEIGMTPFWGVKKPLRVPRSVTRAHTLAFENLSVLEIYDTPDSFVYHARVEFADGALIKVLSPETDEIKYVVKIFEAEPTEEVRNSCKYISSLFGGENFFDFKRYDEYFKTVYNRQKCPQKYEAAYYRIKYPVDFLEYSEEMYSVYLECCAGTIVYYMIQAGKYDDIVNFPYLDKLSEDNFIDLVKASTEFGRHDITAFLLDLKNRRFP